jgi:hypothetical protein
VDEIEPPVRRAQTKRPDLGDHLEHVADCLWAGEGVDFAHQASVQAYLWWDLPRRHEAGDWEALREAAAVLLEEVGWSRLAALANSEQTSQVLEAWTRGRDEGAAACRTAQRSSGVEPPDTDALAWGTVMGPEEALALESVERALSDAVASGELAPGTKRSKLMAAEITTRVLTTPLVPGRLKRIAEGIRDDLDRLLASSDRSRASTAWGSHRCRHQLFQGQSHKCRGHSAIQRTSGVVIDLVRSP